MDNSLTTRLKLNTEEFIGQHFFTATGITIFKKGISYFDLKRHQKDTAGNSIDIVTLEDWSAPLSITQGKPSPLMGYWLPQGQNIDIPAVPAPTDPSFLFTADFSGCSFMVDKLTADTLRVYHVQGGSNYMQTEYLDARHDHGLGQCAAIKVEDYGNDKSPRAFIFMKYDHKASTPGWRIYTQKQYGIGMSYKPQTGDIQTVGAQTICGSNTLLL